MIDFFGNGFFIVGYDDEGIPYMKLLDTLDVYLSPEEVEQKRPSKEELERMLQNKADFEKYIQQAKRTASE